MENKTSTPSEIIENKIFLIRRKRVMFDRDLAILYGVETRNLNQAVKRNIDRFPEDFMFQLNSSEFRAWKSQIVISNSEKMGLRKIPYVFTEQGVAMLSSVLKSKRAIQVNIQIMRTFTKIREMIISNKELRLKMEDLERKYDNKFQVVFDAIKGLLLAQAEEKSNIDNKKIGFKIRK